MRKNKVCAGVTNGSVGLCKGDSGSPLVCKVDGREKVVGISSYVSSNRPSYYPAAFTKVSSYLEWIRKVISSEK
uniref:Peptidase S1 domain-containing protein n=1 Tax=Octopus bimaculoides TaxID=37653 RepID=A0A0L8GY46_OCTBM